MPETLPANPFEPLFTQFQEATIDRAIQAHQASLDLSTPISAAQVEALMKHAETMGRITQLNEQFLAWTQGLLPILQQMAELGIEIPPDLFNQKQQEQEEVPVLIEESVLPTVLMIKTEELETPIEEPASHDEVIQPKVIATSVEDPNVLSPVVGEPEIIHQPEVEIITLPSEPTSISQVAVALPSEQDHMETILSAFGNVATELGSVELSVDEVARILSSNPADTIQVEAIKQRLQNPSFKKMLREARRNSGIRVVIEETWGVLSGLQIHEIPTLRTKGDESKIEPADEPTVEIIPPASEETAIVPVAQAIVSVEQKKKTPHDFELELIDTEFKPALRRKSYDLTTTPELNPLYTITNGSITFDSVAALSFASANISASSRKQIFQSNITPLADAYAQKQITKRQLSTAIWQLIQLDDSHECEILKDAIIHQDNASDIFAALSVRSMVSLGRADIEECNVKRLGGYVGDMLNKIYIAEKMLYLPDQTPTDKAYRTGLLNEHTVQLYELFEVITFRCEDPSDAKVTIYELAKTLVSKKNQKVPYLLQRMLIQMAQEENDLAVQLVRIYKKLGLIDNVNDEEYDEYEDRGKDEIDNDDDYLDDEEDKYIIYRTVRKAQHGY